MRGSLAKARVLYAPVEEIGGEDRLLRACRIHIPHSSVFFLLLVIFLGCKTTQPTQTEPFEPACG